MSIVVAIANPKGGVGKSLTTMMLADGLALTYGARILVIDADPQAGQAVLQLRQCRLGRALCAGRIAFVGALHQVVAERKIGHVPRQRAEMVE